MRHLPCRVFGVVLTHTVDLLIGVNPHLLVISIQRKWVEAIKFTFSSVTLQKLHVRMFPDHHHSVLLSPQKLRIALFLVKFQTRKRQILESSWKLIICFPHAWSNKAWLWATSGCRFLCAFIKQQQLVMHWPFWELILCQWLCYTEAWLKPTAQRLP